MADVDTLRVNGGRRFEQRWREMYAGRLTDRDRKRLSIKLIIREAYIRGALDRPAIEAMENAPEAKPAAPIPPRNPRAHAHTRVVTSIASNSGPVPDSGYRKPGNTGDQILTQSSFIVGEGVGGGAGGTLQCPDELADFDAILRGTKRYRPTASFYAKVVQHFVDVPGLDLVEQATSLLRWLNTTTKGRNRTDIPATAVNWLTNAKDDAIRLQRLARSGRNGTGGTYNARSDLDYGSGRANTETRRSAAAYDQRMRNEQYRDD